MQQNYTENTACFSVHIPRGYNMALKLSICESIFSKHQKILELAYEYLMFSA